MNNFLIKDSEFILENNITNIKTLDNNSNNSNNSNNRIESEKLEKIRKEIEYLSESHHIEIAKILKFNNIKLMENNNGIFINLNNLSYKILDEIVKYLEFIKDQEKIIKLDESKKESIENIYFKDNKDILSYNNEIN